MRGRNEIQYASKDLCKGDALRISKLISHLRTREPFSVPSARELRIDMIEDAADDRKSRRADRKARKLARKIRKFIDKAARSGRGKLIVRFYESGVEDLSISRKRILFEEDGGVLNVRLRGFYGEHASDIPSSAFHDLQAQYETLGYKVSVSYDIDPIHGIYTEVCIRWADPAFMRDLQKVQAGDAELADAYAKHGIPLSDLVAGR